MEYPKVLTITVNSPEEEQQVIGLLAPKQEFPKMLYLHPVDLTKEHKFIVVNTQDEMDEAQSNGYQVEPHVPPAPDDFEEAPGSGTARYPEADAWTETTGEGVTDDTSVTETEQA